MKGDNNKGTIKVKLSPGVVSYQNEGEKKWTHVAVDSEICHVPPHKDRIEDE